MERWRRRRKQLRYICRQGWDLVESLVHAILKLPECARDIRLALNEIREVVNQLRVINSKIRFLPVAAQGDGQGPLHGSAGRQQPQPSQPLAAARPGFDPTVASLDIFSP